MLMDCREAQSLIVPFIENKITDEEKEAFLHHIENCSECYDELEVYFIVFSGIRQLDGETQDISDFKGELKKYIAVQKEALEKKRHRYMRIGILATMSAVILLAAGILFFNMYKTGENYFQNARMNIEGLFTWSRAEPVKKSVEYTLDIERWKKSGYKEIIRKVEEESHEEDRSD